MTAPSTDLAARLWAARLWNPDFVRKIIAVLAYKGGVGKSTIAYELAYMLGAILYDLEHDAGGVTVKWGYRPEERLSAPIIDAIAKKRAPSYLKGAPRRPDLVPGHPELADYEPSIEEMRDMALAWRDAAGGRNLVYDTHPGGNNVTRGVAAAADVIVAPTTLGTNELNALEGMLEELAGYPIIVVPNIVGSISQSTFKRFTRICEDAGVIQGPVIGDYSRWLPGPVRRAAIVSADPPPKLHQQFINEVSELAEVVVKYAVQ